MEGVANATVTVIAEAGVNHNGSLDRALALVETAATAGADVVKFQTFRAASLASKTAPKAAYQKRATDQAESQLEMLQRLELGESEHDQLIDACKARGIEFLSTPFDFGSLDLLAGRLNLPRLKIGSGEITNYPLLLAAAQTGKALILSTGMSTLAEVEGALGVLAFGYLSRESPSLEAFAAAYGEPEGRVALAENVTLLHCTTEYPAPDGEVNLRAMDSLRETFGLPVGLSDHSQGIAIPIAAVGRGAVMIEKHFTLDRKLPGPDHKASLEPSELGEMIAAIRRVEAALGDGVKAPTPRERKNIPIARKSLVAARRIKAGESFTPENLTVKRSGNGISPLRYWDLLGQHATRNYAADEAIEP